MQPGETGKIPLKTHTSKFSGPLSKTITVYTNAPDAGATVQLKMSGTCWLPVEVTPRSATFGRLSSEQAANAPTVKLTVVNNLDQQINLTDIKSSNPVFKAEVRPIDPGKKYEVVVSLAQIPDKPVQKGNISGQITAQTGQPGSPTIEFPVNVFITADIDVQPDNLMLFSGRTTEQKRSFTVRNYSPSPITISNIAVTNQDLKATLAEIEPGKTFRLDVTIPATYQGTPAGDKITMKTSLPAVPELVIPVTERKVPQAATATPTGIPPNMATVRPPAGAAGSAAQGVSPGAPPKATQLAPSGPAASPPTSLVPPSNSAPPPAPPPEAKPSAAQ